MVASLSLTCFVFIGYLNSSQPDTRMDDSGVAALVPCSSGHFWLYLNTNQEIAPKLLEIVLLFFSSEMVWFASQVGPKNTSEIFLDSKIAHRTKSIDVFDNIG